MVKKDKKLRGLEAVINNPVFNGFLIFVCLTVGLSTTTFIGETFDIDSVWVLIIGVVLGIGAYITIYKRSGVKIKLY